MKITPAKSFRSLAFYTLAGPSRAVIDDEQVKGRLLDVHSESRIRRAGSRAEEFANWPKEAESILKFTQKYGPLERGPFTLPSGSNGEFVFSLERWRNLQEAFRQMWEGWGHIPAHQLEASVYEVAPREQLVRRRSGLEYRAANLWRLLLFDLGSVPIERLRKCARPDCPHPYLVARHLKQRYCSDACASWGQKQWKLQWWTEHGDIWRAKRKKKLKHGKM